MKQNTMKSQKQTSTAQGESESQGTKDKKSRDQMYLGDEEEIDPQNSIRPFLEGEVEIETKKPFDEDAVAVEVVKKKGKKKAGKKK